MEQFVVFSVGKYGCYECFILLFLFSDNFKCMKVYINTWKFFSFCNVYQDPVARLIRDLREEIARLQNLLQSQTVSTVLMWMVSSYSFILFLCVLLVFCSCICLCSGCSNMFVVFWCRTLLLMLQIIFLASVVATFCFLLLPQLIWFVSQGCCHCCCCCCNLSLVTVAILI